MIINRVIEINNMLEFLSMAWKKNPDLRLMQLLGNGFPEGDNYYVDDKKVMDYLVKLVNEVED
jgi:uncharacterized protein YihD (DUF1040 family)